MNTEAFRRKIKGLEASFAKNEYSYVYYVTEVRYSKDPRTGFVDETRRKVEISKDRYDTITGQGPWDQGRFASSGTYYENLEVDKLPLAKPTLGDYDLDLTKAKTKKAINIVIDCCSLAIKFCQRNLKELDRYKETPQILDDITALNELQVEYKKLQDDAKTKLEEMQLLDKLKKESKANIDEWNEQCLDQTQEMERLYKKELTVASETLSTSAYLDFENEKEYELKLATLKLENELKLKINKEKLRVDEAKAEFENKWH